MGLMHRKYPYLLIQETDYEEPGLVFLGRSWWPEWVTLETIYRLKTSEENKKYILSTTIYDCYEWDEVLIVRSRAARPLWWFLWRVWESLVFVKAATIRFLTIWGIAHGDFSVYQRWRDIRPIGWPYEKIKRID